MTHATDGRMRVSPQRDIPAKATKGFVPGTIIYTLDGALPVEFLTPGDRIITRAGARELRGVRARVIRGIRSLLLEFDAPQMVYADGVAVPA